MKCDNFFYQLKIIKIKYNTNVLIHLIYFPYIIFPCHYLVLFNSQSNSGISSPSQIYGLFCGVIYGSG